jgi:2-polyprenyl-6-methoxyphenol hydroxylase-like FAD-dependent oxidoreductase
LAAETATAGGLFLPQGETEALLLHAATAHGLTEVRFGHALLSFLQDAEGVSVALQPPDGPPYTLRGAYLVGCDGAHSTVREQLGWHLEGKTYPTRIMLADVRLPDARTHLPWPRLAAGEAGVSAALRISEDLWRLIGTVSRDADEAEAVSEGRIRALVATLFGPGPFEFVWASLFHIHCRTSPHFRHARVLLAGDAAHLNSPAGGQGMNSGIQDAHNLAWKLARAIAGGDAESLLASYEAERRPVILANVDRFTDMATRWLLLPRPRVRGAVARLMARALARPAINRELSWRLGMFDARYKRSPLISGSGWHLGGRAPDREIMEGDGHFLRLYDLVGPEAVLLLFDDGLFPLWRPGQVENWMTGFPGVKVVRVLPREAQPVTGWFWDAEGALYRAWRAEPGTAALIRPDTMVGWRDVRPTEEAMLRGVEVGLGVARTALPVPPRAL